MKIALDFDGTFTEDPYFWNEFVDRAPARGHEVFIVTARDELNDGINWARLHMSGPPCRVIFCDGRPKRKIAIGIDVWIDDNPYGIIGATSFSSPTELAAWRRQDIYRGSKLPVTGESRGFAKETDDGRAHEAHGQVVNGRNGSLEGSEAGYVQRRRRSPWGTG